MNTENASEMRPSGKTTNPSHQMTSLPLLSLSPKVYASCSRYARERRVCLIAGLTTSRCDRPLSHTLWAFLRRVVGRIVRPGSKPLRVRPQTERERERDGGGRSNDDTYAEVGTKTSVQHDGCRARNANTSR